MRAYNGQNSRWYKAAVRQKAGRITAAGMTKEVTFEPVDGPINDLSTTPTGRNTRQPVPQPMINERARSATVKIVPRKSKG